MPYCPTCKKEYPLGTTICVDCNVSLIDNKAADLVSLVSLNNKEQAERFVAYLKEQEIESTYEYGVREDNYRIYVDKKDKRAAMKGFITFQTAEKRSRAGDAAPAAPAPAAEPPMPKPGVSPSAEAARAVVAAALKKEAEEAAAKEAAAKAAAGEAAAEIKPAKSKKSPVVGLAETYEEPDFIERGELPYETSSEPVITEFEAKKPAAKKPAPVPVTIEAEDAATEPVAEVVASEPEVSEPEAIEEPVAVPPEAPAEEPAAAAPEVTEEPEISEPAAEAEPEEEPAAVAEPEPVVEKAPIPVTAVAEDEDESEEEDDSDDDEDEDDADDGAFDDEPEDDEEDEEDETSAPPVFTANAATRTKLPVRQKEINPPSSTPDGLFEARKTPKKRPSLYDELEKNEEAASAAAAEEPTIDFTPKRPLTAYQFEKKRQEDLENFASSHKAPVLDEREPEAIAAGEGNEGGMNIAFSNYEQQYVMPSYEDDDQPKPVYQSNAKSIDWGAGAEDIEVKFEKDSEPEAEEPVSEPEPAAEPEPEVVAEEPAVAEIVEEPQITEEIPVSEEVEEPSAPIFVEVERVEHEELDDDRIIDEADIRSFKDSAAQAEAEAPAPEAPAEEPYVSPVQSADDPLDYADTTDTAEGASNDAFSDFLNNFKKATLSKTRKKTEPAPADPKNTIASVANKPVAVPEVSKAAQKKPVMADTAAKPTPKAASAPAPVKEEKMTTETLFDNVAAPAVDTIVEEIVPDSKYQSTETADFEAVPSRPTDIQDTKIKVSLDDSIIEEVISSKPTQDDLPNIAQSSSFANEKTDADAAFADVKTPKAPKRMEIPDEELDPDGTYRGFVPDYSPTDLSGNDEPAEESEYDEFKKKVHSRKEENAAINAQIKKEQVRQANLVKDFGKNGKIVFEDTDDLDNYAGFVPDYTPNTTNEAEFDFYKPHQVSSYAKYKKNKKGEAEVNAQESFMRLTSDEEADHLFVSHIPSFAKREIEPADLKNAAFLLCFNYKRLAKLFNSWMMLNITQQTVRAFESENASDQQNYERKIAGIKKLLIDNFGDLNEVFLDNLVQRYYSKFLEE